MTDGIPVWRFYTVAALTGIIGMIGGYVAGEQASEARYSNHVIAQQGTDNEIISEEYEAFPRDPGALREYILRHGNKP